MTDLPQGQFQPLNPANFPPLPDISPRPAAGDHGHALGTTEEIVATNEGTTSTSFTNLATAGPAVTVTVGPSGIVVVNLYAALQLMASNHVSIMSFEMSGANTLAAADARAMHPGGGSAGTFTRMGVTHTLTGLTPGSTTFTAKYRVTGGTGAFVDRRISVVPL